LEIALICVNLERDWFPSSISKGIVLNCSILVGVMEFSSLIRVMGGGGEGLDNKELEGMCRCIGK
jgi:hypothetical protein